MYMYVCVCTYIYIYIYIYSQQHNKRGVAPRRLPDEARSGARRGTTRVSTNGVSANYILFDRDFWVLPLAYFYLSQSARAYLFPQSVKNHYFGSGPVGVDPICPQPRRTADRSGSPPRASSPSSCRRGRDPQPSRRAESAVAAQAFATSSDSNGNGKGNSSIGT